MKKEEIMKIIEMLKVFTDNKDDIEKVIEAVKPVAGECINLVMDTVGPEIEKIITRISLSGVEVKSKVYQAYIDKGFTEDQAFDLIMDFDKTLKTMMTSVNKK